MKIVAIALFLFSTLAQAAPFVIADVVPEAVTCGVLLDGEPKVFVQAMGGNCKFDIANVSVGSHTIAMTAMPADNPATGQSGAARESPPSIPLVFSRLPNLDAPSALRIAP